MFRIIELYLFAIFSTINSVPIGPDINIPIDLCAYNNFNYFNKSETRTVTTKSNLTNHGNYDLEGCIDLPDYKKSKYSSTDKKQVFNFKELLDLVRPNLPANEDQIQAKMLDYYNTLNLKQRLDVSKLRSESFREIKRFAAASQRHTREVQVEYGRCPKGQVDWKKTMCIPCHGYPELDSTEFCNSWLLKTLCYKDWLEVCGRHDEDRTTT